MDIRIPTRLTNFRLYDLAKSVIERYELDSVNINEYPIICFNKLAESSGIKIDEEFNEGLSKVFVLKGSIDSCRELMKLLNIDFIRAYVDGDDLVLHLDLGEIDNSDFVQYLRDCFNYLLFYQELIVKVDTLVKSLVVKGLPRLSVMGIDVAFIGLDE
jgi:hypothetical protein